MFVLGKCWCPENDVCEMSSDHVPKIQLDLDDGLCPQRQTDCTAVIVYGDNFERRSDLVCQATKIEVRQKSMLSIRTKQLLIITLASLLFDWCRSGVLMLSLASHLCSCWFQSRRVMYVRKLVNLLNAFGL